MVVVLPYNCASQLRAHGRKWPDPLVQRLILEHGQAVTVLSGHLHLKRETVVVLVERQARDDDLSRSELRVVRLRVEMILLTDLLDGRHARQSGCVNLLLQHALVVLKLNCCLLQIPLIRRQRTE